MSASAEINLANAQHSTGPRTEAGRAAVRFNAVKTGIYSQTIILPHEDPAAYASLGARLKSRFGPVTEDEERLTQTLQDTEWRIARVVAVENNLHMIGIAEHSEKVRAEFGEMDEATCSALAQASAFQANGRLFEQIARQEGRLRRLFDKTMKELKSLLDSRVAAPEPQRPVSAAAPVQPIANTPDPAPRSPNGFVSPKLHKYYKNNPDMPVFTGSMAEHKCRQWLQKNGRKY